MAVAINLLRCQSICLYRIREQLICKGPLWTCSKSHTSHQLSSAQLSSLTCRRVWPMHFVSSKKATPTNGNCIASFIASKCIELHWIALDCSQWLYYDAVGLGKVARNLWHLSRSFGLNIIGQPHVDCFSSACADSLSLYLRMSVCVRLQRCVILRPNMTFIISNLNSITIVVVVVVSTNFLVVVVSMQSFLLSHLLSVGVVGIVCAGR